jgi:hypothetical protein
VSAEYHSPECVIDPYHTGAGRTEDHRFFNCRAVPQDRRCSWERSNGRCNNLAAPDSAWCEECAIACTRRLSERISAGEPVHAVGVTCPRCDGLGTIAQGEPAIEIDELDLEEEEEDRTPIDPLDDQLTRLASYVNVRGGEFLVLSGTIERVRVLVNAMRYDRDNLSNSVVFLEEKIQQDLAGSQYQADMEGA